MARLSRFGQARLSICEDSTRTVQSPGHKQAYSAREPRMHCFVPKVPGPNPRIHPLPLLQFCNPEREGVSPDDQQKSSQEGATHVVRTERAHPEIVWRCTPQTLLVSLAPCRVRRDAPAARVARTYIHSGRPVWGTDDTELPICCALRGAMEHPAYRCKWWGPSTSSGRTKGRVRVWTETLARYSKHNTGPKHQAACMRYGCSSGRIILQERIRVTKGLN